VPGRSDHLPQPLGTDVGQLIALEGRGGQLDVLAIQQGQLAAGVEGAGELAHALIRLGMVDGF
jgi:hypothetical protein